MGYSESLFFWDTCGWSLNHSHDAVCICLPLSYSAWKSSSSSVMVVQISVPCWGNLTSLAPVIAILPSCVIVSSQAAGHTWAAPYLQPEFIQRLGAHCLYQFRPHSLHNISVNFHQQLTWEPLFFLMSDSITCAPGFKCTFFLSIRTLTMGSTLFNGDFGKKLVPEFHPLVSLDTPGLCILTFCICSTGMVF